MLWEQGVVGSNPAAPIKERRRPHRSRAGVCSRQMTDIGDSLFHKGQDVWVMEPDGSRRAAEYVGQGEMSAWFGGTPTVIVVYPDTRSGEAVAVDRVIARHE
jgi:hypothetical protein